MVRVDLRQHALSARQLQCVKEIGTAEGFAFNFGHQQAVIVMDDVIRPDQHIHLAAEIALGAAAFLAAIAIDAAFQHAELDFDLAAVEHLAGNSTP